MPESTLNTRVEKITHHMNRVRELLDSSPKGQELEQIQTELGLTKQQTLSVLERLETLGEIYRSSRIWQKIDKCCLCDDPVKVVFNRIPYCAAHDPHRREKVKGER
jgi:hypothetical protein